MSLVVKVRKAATTGQTEPRSVSLQLQHSIYREEVIHWHLRHSLPYSSIPVAQRLSRDFPALPTSQFRLFSGQTEPILNQPDPGNTTAGRGRLPSVWRLRPSARFRGVSPGRSIQASISLFTSIPAPHRRRRGRVQCQLGSDATGGQPGTRLARQVPCIKR